MMAQQTTHTVTSLLKAPPAERGPQWELDFLKSLGSARLKVVNPDVIQGPDHWPYLLVETESASASDVDSTGDFDSVAQITDWLGPRGVGLVINPNQSIPDYVLSYGQIWNFRERGEFVTQLHPMVQERPTGLGQAPTKAQFEIKHGDQLYVGPPSQLFLPSYVRGVLGEFFKRQGVPEVKVLMVSKDQTQWELAVSLESLGLPPEPEHGGILEAISWFLPTHYSVILLSEKVLTGFVPLNSLRQ